MNVTAIFTDFTCAHEIAVEEDEDFEHTINVPDGRTGESCDHITGGSGSEEIVSEYKID